ncbi:MAG: hypothetical protein R3E01_24970 [Pirellulaceae bacterium]|nr:hypothetical protein [Planctomycetales bacterium]
MKPLIPLCLLQLVATHATAKLRRSARGFCTPRKLILSTLAILMAAIWLGNATLSVFYRESAKPETLSCLIPLSLLAYAVWHVLRLAYNRPEEGLEWTPAELEVLHGAPLTRRDLILYRLTMVAMAGIFKAGCFALLMLPDFPNLLLSFAGAFLALMSMDVYRMTLEVYVCGLTRRTYHRLRAGALIAMCLVAASVWTSSGIVAEDASSSPVGVVGNIVAAAAPWQQHTWIGRTLDSPFRVFYMLMSAPDLSATTWVAFAISVIILVDLVQVLLIVDRRTGQKVQRRQRGDYDRLRASLPTRADGHGPNEGPTVTRAIRLPRVPWFAGIGPIVWRQLLGAWHYSGSLLVALAVPTVLACGPLILVQDRIKMAINVVGALAFYSFLLLPTALKFDFRRDIDRMAVLKSLPIRPLAVVLGQLSTPVLIASVYQAAVLAVTGIVRPVSPVLLISAMLLMLPLNHLIFALDNLIFLLFPYRVNQEGIEIFLRSTLTFTAKGMLFGFATALLFGWAMITPVFAAHWIDARLLFVIGVWCILLSFAVGCTWLLTRTFTRFDPSQDVPA